MEAAEFLTRKEASRCPAASTISPFGDGGNLPARKAAGTVSRCLQYASMKWVDF